MTQTTLNYTLTGTLTSVASSTPVIDVILIAPSVGCSISVNGGDTIALAANATLPISVNDLLQIKASGSGVLAMLITKTL